MADANRGNRPLSPHLSIYRPQLNSAMSIFHRVTGIALVPGGVLLVWWFLAAAAGPDAFAFADGLITSWLGGLLMLGMAAALWYHFFNGIRHLVWDTGAGLKVEDAMRSGMAALAATGVMTVLTLILALV